MFCDEIMKILLKQLAHNIPSIPLFVYLNEKKMSPRSLFLSLVFHPNGCGHYIMYICNWLCRAGGKGNKLAKNGKTSYRKFYDTLHGSIFWVDSPPSSWVIVDIATEKYTKSFFCDNSFCKRRTVKYLYYKL